MSLFDLFGTALPRDEVPNVETNNDHYIRNYPEPFSAQTIIELRDTRRITSLCLYDINARKLADYFSYILADNPEGISISIGNLANGTYYLLETTDNGFFCHSIHCVR
jgi:hypothetical protein